MPSFAYWLVLFTWNAIAAFSEKCVEKFVSWTVATQLSS